MRELAPFAVIRALADLTDSVLVGVSGGKDSTVTLDLCARHFKTVAGYFMYLVPGLYFQERWLQATERRYRIAIHRRPHWMLSQLYRHGAYRPKSFATDKVTPIRATDAENALREQTGLDWIVTGERMAESLQRRGMISACKGLDQKRRRCYPIAHWPVEAVRHYLRSRNLTPSPDSAMLGRSFGDLNAETLAAVQQHWPDDFRTIKEHFPHVEAVLARQRFFGGQS